MNKQLLQTAKPIIFNTEMVKAILDGRKTQFRTAIKEDFYYKLNKKTRKLPYVEKYINKFIIEESKYKVGDILYVRETFYPLYNDEDSCVYKADYPLHWTAVDAVYGDIETDTETEKVTKWKPSIHMPKKYARIFLKIINVRVERLQDILKEDALKEIGKGSWLCELANMYPNYQDYQRGFNDIDYDLQGKNVNGAICSFRTLWNSTAKDGYRWKDNPYVFVYEFEKVEVC